MKKVAVYTILTIIAWTKVRKYSYIPSNLHRKERNTFQYNHQQDFQTRQVSMNKM